MWAGERGIAARKALHGGILGSLGVMAGWLVWLAGHAFQKDALQVLAAPVIGAVAVGLYELLKEYVRVSLDEHRKTEGDPKQGAESPAAAPVSRAGRSIAFGGLVFALLAGVCTNLVGDLMARMIKPFLVVLATMAPIGAWLGFAFHVWREWSNGMWMRGLRGLVVGAGAGVIAFIVSVAAGLADISWGPLMGAFGWWALLGIGWSLAFGEAEEPQPFAPVLGLALAVGLVGLSTVNASAGWLGLVKPVTDRLARYALAYPGLPAEFFKRANEALAKKEAREKEKPLCASCQAALKPPNLIGRAPPPERVPGAKPVPAPEHVRKLLAPLAAPPTPAEERMRELSRQLSLGWNSVLVQSWLVLMLFSLGAGAAQVSEQTLRPAEYAQSATRISDLWLARFTVLAWIAALVTARLLNWT